MSRLLGKAVLVTGGSRGVGLATARRLLAAGARVAITGPDAGSLKAAQRSLGGNVLPLRVDAADAAAQRDIARTLGVAFGALDSVFVGTGHGRLPLVLVEALLPVFADPASVVLTAVIELQRIRPGVYEEARAALLWLAGILSTDLACRGVRVEATGSGPITSVLYDDAGCADAAGNPDASAKMLEKVLATRRNGPDAIAEPAVFLRADAGAFVVSSELVIRGGDRRV